MSRIGPCTEKLGQGPVQRVWSCGQGVQGGLVDRVSRALYRGWGPVDKLPRTLHRGWDPVNRVSRALYKKGSTRVLYS